jgi:hypothetical protein
MMCANAAGIGVLRWINKGKRKTIIILTEVFENESSIE